MFRYRSVIVSLIFFFLLLGALNAFASCFLETDVSAKSTGQIPSSISCLDNEVVSYQINLGQEKIYYPKIKRTPNTYHVAFLHGGPTYLALTRPSGTVFVPFLIPIYQFKTAYRI